MWVALWSCHLPPSRKCLPTPPCSLLLLQAGGEAARRGAHDSLAQPLIPEADSWILGGLGELAGGRGTPQADYSPLSHWGSPNVCFFPTT